MKNYQVNEICDAIKAHARVTATAVLWATQSPSVTPEKRAELLAELIDVSFVHIGLSNED